MSIFSNIVRLSISGLDKGKLLFTANTPLVGNIRVSREEGWSAGNATIWAGNKTTGYVILSPTSDTEVNGTTPHFETGSFAVITGQEIRGCASANGQLTAMIYGVTETELPGGSPAITPPPTPNYPTDYWALWKMSNYDNDFLYDEGENWDLGILGATSTIAGPVGTSVQLAGGGSDNRFDVSGSLTGFPWTYCNVCFFILCDHTGANYGNLSFGCGTSWSASRRRIRCHTSASGLYFHWGQGDTGNGIQTTIAVSPAAGTNWIHVVVRPIPSGASDELEIIIDGVSQGLTGSTGEIRTGSEITMIGARLSNQLNTELVAVQQLALYDRDLTAQEMSDMAVQ